MPEDGDENTIAANKLKERCDASGLQFETGQGATTGNQFYRVGFKSGRDTIWETYRNVSEAENLLSVEFESYVFHPDFVALCSYKNSRIEFSIRPATEIGPSQIYRNLLGVNVLLPQAYVDSKRLMLEPPSPGLPSISFGTASDDFYKIVAKSLVLKPITIMLDNACFENLESATKLIIKISNSILFQLELISNIFLIVEKRPTTNRVHRHDVSEPPPMEMLQYPKTEYNEAPMSLYWYGSSASRTPLIQFLAYYQVIEYHYPVYSGKEARRKIRTVLKNPTFRFNREADIGKLLAIIEGRNSIGSPNEPAQLEMMLRDCVDESALRDFFEQDQNRKKFFQKKKSVSKYSISVAETSDNFRQAIAKRIYDIRCRIVHTKADLDEDNFALLPNSKEVKELAYDIELVRYIAQCVLKDMCSPLDVSRL